MNVTRRGILIGVGMILFHMALFSVSAEVLADTDSLFVTLEGVTLHYKSFGDLNDCDKTVMLLFHGFGSSTYTWEKMIEAYKGRYIMITYDRPPFGLSERILDTDKRDINWYGFSNQAVLARQLLRFLKLDDRTVFLIGHSAGTPIALDYYQKFPDNIVGLILISPALEHAFDENPFAKLFTNPLIRNSVSLFKGFLVNALESGLDEAWYDDSKITTEVREAYRKYTRIDDWEKALIEFTLNQGDFDMTACFETVDMDTLCIMGEYDRVVNLEKIRKSASKNDNITLEIISNSGHVPHEESYRHVNQVIGKWIKILEEERVQ